MLQAYAACSVLMLCHYQSSSQSLVAYTTQSTAGATVLLDFDGHYVSGTSWNWDSSINAAPSGLPATVIKEIFDRVSEDFRIFELNITTDSLLYLAAPQFQRTRIIITPSSKWYGQAGGVAYIGSFTWGDETPAWVFNNLLGNDPKYISEAVAHEIGHTLGLQHQSQFNNTCALTTEYFEGIGDGEIGWAPIMGVGYYKNVTTWHNGPSVEGCSVYQDDIQKILSLNNLQLRNDDHSDEVVRASDISVTGGAFVVKGMVNNDLDRDAFKFTLNAPTQFRASVVPNNVGENCAGANTDMKLTLLNSGFDTIGVYNPSTLLSAALDTNLNAGGYYVVVEGVGNNYLPEYGSIGYYTFSSTASNALPVNAFTLRADKNGDQHQLKWTFSADEPLKEASVEYSENGRQFRTLTSLQSSSHAYSYRPSHSRTLYYRVKLVTQAEERNYYSNIVSVNGIPGDMVRIYNNVSSSNMSTVLVAQDSRYNVYDATGRLLSRGQFRTGMNALQLSSFQQGIVTLHVLCGEERYQFKLIKR
jgi:hypothetical protein